MNIVTFEYVDAKGKRSTRSLLVLVEPTTLISGIDITELTSEEDVALLNAALELAREKYNKEIGEIAARYDLKHKYRAFKPENMSNIKTELI